MPPKKTPTKVTTSSRPPPNRKLTGARQNVGPAAKKTVAPGKKVQPAKPAPKKEMKKGPTPQELAAIVIQRYIRRFLASVKLMKLKKQKLEYEEIIEKLQREAFIAMVKAEQEAAERQLAKEDEERKRKKEEAKRRVRMLEAAFDGDIEEMETILKEVKDIDTKNGEEKYDISSIVRRNHLMAIIECEDANGNTPLSEASGGGNSDTIKFLIERGADLNSVGAWGRTPLYRAAFGGHLDAVETLLQYGADPRIYAEDGNTPELVSSVEMIVEILKNWDMTITESLLGKMETEKEKRMEEDRVRKEAQTNKLQDQLHEVQKDYEAAQMILQRAYDELEKRIHEHDTLTTEGSELTNISLQTVHDAEGELEIAKMHAEKARTTLEQSRLKLREQQHEDLANLL